MRDGGRRIGDDDDDAAVPRLWLSIVSLFRVKNPTEDAGRTGRGAIKTAGGEPGCVGKSPEDRGGFTANISQPYALDRMRFCDRCSP